jgi:hypothetical protein
MMFIGPHVFEVVEGKNKLLKLKAVSDEEMGPYRTDKNADRGVSFDPAIAAAYRDTVQDDLLMITKKIFNEGYIMKSKTLDSLEALAKYYDFKQILAWFDRYWDDLDKLEEINGLAAEAKNRPLKEHDILKVIRDFKDDIELSDLGPEMKLARITYLEEKFENLSSQIKDLELSFRMMENKDEAAWMIQLSKDFSGYDKLVGKLKSIQIAIGHLKGVFKDGKKVVTDDMILAAKQVPFEKILKLESAGSRKRCLCPFHNEKTASFYIYPDTNRGHCHACGKNVDTIQYLVEIEKLGFNEAVLQLLQY